MNRPIYDVDSDISGIDLTSSLFYSHNILTEAFIEKYQDKLNWYNISWSQILSEYFIEKFRNKVYWYAIAERQKLSEAFIEKYQYRLGWVSVSQYQKLSKEFIKKHEKEIIFEDLNLSKYLTLDIFKAYFKKFNSKLFALNLKDPAFAIHVFLYRYYSIDDIINSIGDKIDWEFISMVKDFSKEDLQSDNAIIYLNFDILKERYPEYF